MKKTIGKMICFIMVFLVTVVAAEKIMNQGHENMTMEMAEATFPLIIMEKNGEEYNELHGYQNAMDHVFQKKNTTVLESDRSIGFFVETFGEKIDQITVEVRSIDGSRLIEKTEIQEWNEAEERIHQRIQLKDLIEKDVEYLMVITVSTGGKEIRYYSRILWSDTVYVDEKINFVKDFHNRLMDKDAAREIAKYLEPNAQLEDNKSFYKVNIHSSFRQITYGSLPIQQETEPVVQISDITSTTASILLDFIVSTDDGNGNKTYYTVQEYYNIWYNPEVQYLMDYERTMTQLPDLDNFFANDKILLGITDWNLQMKENEDGNVVAFEDAGQLFCYNMTTNSLAVIFSFYDKETADRRTMYDQHAIKILNVTEGGNVEFAVYGYMNRGRHEGEVGIQLCSYDNIYNTIEEIIYIPFDKSFDILKNDMEKLLYLSREQKLFLFLENNAYTIDLADRTLKVIANVKQDDFLQISEDNRIMVSLVLNEEEDSSQCRSINVRNLGNETEKLISAGLDEAIRPLGFMGEDIIYGIAKNSDIVVENTGRVFFPMYKMCISDYNGNLLKSYEQPDVYITGCQIEGNQITIERMLRNADGNYEEIEDDHITNNTEEISGKNTIAAADIDIYERYVQIQTRAAIDVKSLKKLTPKEVVFEGRRNLMIEGENPDRFYVYGAYGVEGIYNSAASAVNHAYEKSCVVTDLEGKIIWRNASRANRNQIMAIKEETITEEKGSIAVCIETILKYEGVVSNAESLMEKGQSVIDILENCLDGYKILDLTGCSLNAVLYYVNLDIPVMALLKNNEAVLITGFNNSEVVIMEPSTGSLYKKAINATIEWLGENDNSFITYQR